jgi:hypothetical protein
MRQMRTHTDPRSSFMYDHERNGERARAARIRLAHDDEATRLETMRHRSPPIDPRANRPGTIGRLAAAVARLRGRGHARAQDLQADCEPG